MKIIQSVGTNQHEILNDIISLHNDGKPFDLDCTYSTGQFYKSGLVPEPLHKSDLEPKFPDVVEASSDDLPFEDNSLQSIMFDPPFVISGRTYSDSADSSCKISKRFSCYFSYEELKSHYRASLEEFYRVLKPGGIVVFKLQNTITSGRNCFTHFFTVRTALETGFYPHDEFVLHNKSKMTSFGGRWKTQRHAMKHHSYFLVFRKMKSKVDYT